MGQHLNIEIHENGKCLANAYYHWSAYTPHALKLTQAIIDYYPHRQYNDGVNCAYELLRRIGATFYTDELIRMGLNEDLATMLGIGASRNKGLISITEAGIEDTRYWEEGRVEIDIGDNIINFCVLTEYEPYEFEWDYAPAYIDVPFNNHHIPFNSFNEFKSYFNDVEQKVYQFKGNRTPMVPIY